MGRSWQYVPSRAAFLLIVLMGGAGLGEELGDEYWDDRFGIPGARDCRKLFASTC
jgi:hypothetical protein